MKIFVKNTKVFTFTLWSLIIFILVLSSIMVDDHFSCEAEAAPLIKHEYNFGVVNKYKKYILKYSRKHQLNPYLIAGIIIQEGCYNGCYSKKYGRNRGNSSEYSLFQIMPYHVKNPKRLMNIDYNFEIGTKYLALMIKQKGLVNGISAYNRGPNGKFNFLYTRNVLYYKKQLEKGEEK